MPKRATQEDVDTDYEEVSRLADRLNLKGRDRQKYVREHMTGLGHREESHYVPHSDDDDDDDSGSRYSPRRSGRGRRGRGSDDDDW